jgi:phosphoglycerol transferase MdoB-like AlkP superfamily enzyme
LSELTSGAFAAPSLWLRVTSPYLVLIRFAVLALLLLSLSRLGLFIWQWQRVEQSSSNAGWLLLQGVRADLILVGLMLLVPMLLAPVLARRSALHVWQVFTLSWVMLMLALLLLVELSTPAFLLQYDVRPNRLYLEYLKYPKEVFSTLWHGFRLPLVAGTTGTLLLLFGAYRYLRRGLVTVRCDCNKTLWLSWPLLLFLVFVAIRSTTQHRPANPAIFAITSDAMVNSLVVSSPYSVLYAAYSMRHEASSSEIYGKLPVEQMLQSALDWPWLKNLQFNDKNLPTLHQQQATAVRSKPLNIVIVLQESMGATFVQSLGGEAVTPELEKLKQQGIWFNNMYATGTRSVRGIEAVVAGFAPTPAQSTVKLSNSQHNFSTIASILKRQGYHTQFIYGGEAHFDNMRSYFTGNGFSDIVDFTRINKPAFVGSWGASDEDLFRTAHTELQQLHQQGKPFFSLIFTSSNHEPFEFPDSRISLHQAPKAQVNNAVKYADWAMGQFFQQAMQADYWQDTLFLVVADHDNRVYGSNLVPVEKFQIPALILGADVKPQQINTLASQIDLAPTILSMAGISACHPLTGRDFSRDSQSPGRALLQFDQYFALMQQQGLPNEPQQNEQHELVILKPNQQAVKGRYNKTTKHLSLSSEAVSAGEKTKALAEVQLPSYLYREQKFQDKTACVASV